MLVAIQGLARRLIRSFTTPALGGYSTAQKLLHWGIALLCLAQVPTARAIQRTHMGHGFLRPSEADLFLHSVHAWVGWIIFGLVGARLVIRARNDGPASLVGIRPVHRIAATMSHLALYALLIALPITGTITMYVSQSYAPIHRALSWTLLAVVTLHIVVAIWHHVVLRDGTLSRMLPNSTRSGFPSRPNSG